MSVAEPVKRLVSQREPRIEQFVRQENEQWLLREIAGLKATLTVPSLEIKISLAEVFAGVEFVPAPIRPQTPPRRPGRVQESSQAP